MNDLTADLLGDQRNRATALQIVAGLPRARTGFAASQPIDTTDLVRLATWIIEGRDPFALEPVLSDRPDILIEQTLDIPIEAVASSLMETLRGIIRQAPKPEGDESHDEDGNQTTPADGA
jgi:hypothetical protein